MLLNSILTGTPEPSIKWFREGKEISDQADFEITFTNGRVALTIPEVFDEDAGKFTCFARNAVGTAASSAELIVRGESERLQWNPIREVTLRKGRPLCKGHWTVNLNINILILPLFKGYILVAQRVASQEEFHCTIYYSLYEMTKNNDGIVYKCLL